MPLVTNREPKEKVQQVEETEGSSVDGSDPQLLLENRVRMLLRRVASAELHDALDSEERRARRVRQEMDSAEHDEQKRRRQQGEPTRSETLK